MTNFHEEQRFHQWWIWALLLVVAAPLLLVAATRGLVLPLMLALLIVLVVGVLLASARLVVDVDSEAITVAFHFLWPKRRIPLSEVRSAKATTYHAILDYGGYGVRLGLRGWAFNVSGNEGVLVETKNGWRLMIGSQRAKELEAAIARGVRGESA